MSARKSLHKAKNSSEKFANLQISLTKKKKCQAKALKVVQTLLEDSVVKDTFIESCQHINQSYYRDVIEERAVAMLCGYPLCSNRLQKIPAQKYHISLKYNKVFDIGERKYFCSNWCFKASKFLEMQLPSSPLWLLDDSCSVHVTLLEVDEQSEGMGEEICFEIEGIKQELKDFVKSQDYSVSSSKTLPESKSVQPKIAIKVTSVCELTSTMSKVSFDKLKTSSAECSSRTPTSIHQQSSQKFAAYNAPEKFPPKEIKSQHVQIVTITSNQLVEQCLKQWLTVESLTFLLGSENFKRAVEIKGHNFDQLAESWGLKEACDRRAFANRYRMLCTKLDIQEKEDSNLDNELTQAQQNETERKRKKKMPSFEQLPQKFEVQCLNVEAFYKGKMEILTEIESLNTNPKNKQNEMPSTEKDAAGDQQPISLPLIDSHAQNALRQRIVLDRLNRNCETLFQSLNFSTQVDIASEMRQFVSTFNLQANNITFKPLEWMLVALILVHLLSIKDQTLQTTLESETAQKCITILLNSFQQDINYLKRVSEWLMDVEHLIQKMK